MRPWVTSEVYLNKKVREVEEMEEEMMEVEPVFVAYEIDLDYEFDAARFFDFTREETPAEARQAEVWFETAGSYPPSPFVSKLVMRDDILLDNSNSRFSAEIEFSEKDMDDNGSKEADGKISASLLGGALQSASNQSSQVKAGLTFCAKTISDSLNSKAKAAMLKCSTLMKSTASQLAKQNRPPLSVGSRFQKLLAQHNERSSSIASGVENQASKRQKLEGGVLRKIVVADAKQQTNFVHKAPKKDVTIEQNAAHAKLKLTIPREPDLETAHRAQRIRPRNAAEAENVKVDVHRFKARPLNRKILDAPSLPLPKRSAPKLPEFQEFHLKTLERAMQQSSASSSSLHCTDSDKGLGKYCAISALENRTRDSRRPSTMSTSKHDKLNSTRNFKARPLNKKIFSSKGDIGVFWNSKQETTVPMEFNLHTEKRVQHNPPVELFSKLSLASELQQNNGSQLKPPRHTSLFRKDSKENISSSFHPERKEKPSIFGGKQSHCGSNDCVNEAGTLLSARRSLGIR